MFAAFRCMFIIICAFWFLPVAAQLVYYQDVFRGGVTGGGYNPSWLGNTSGEIELYIEPGSTLRRAILFVGIYGEPINTQFWLNGIPFEVDENSVIHDEFSFVQSASFTFGLRCATLDVTFELQNSIEAAGLLSIPITPPLNQPPVTSGARLVEYYLLISYENNTMGQVTALAMINQQNTSSTMTYQTTQHNNIDLFYQTGLAIHGSQICNINYDGSYVSVEDQMMGLIGGKDINNIQNCSGSTGTFYYQNHQLYGLSDDTANTTMHGSDALADISPYLTSSSELEVRIEYQMDTQPNFPQSNAIWQLFFAYTSTCEAFETTLTERVKMCANESSVQLEATGGQSYHWWPADNLSCTDCPNPVYSGTESANYHVQIWNNDSCSKILPVRIDVVDTPHSANLSTNPATCGGAGGELIIGNISGGQSAYQYSLGNAWTGNPTANIFSNLPAGDYTFFVRDQNLCMYSQAFTIEEINPAQAVFTANPQSGTEPLAVQFNNQSSGATDYQWSVGDSISTSFNFNYTFDTAGSYPVQLISWYNEPQCADTAMATIIVNPDYTHSLFLPTLYDNFETAYTIQTTNVVQLEYELYNTIGQRLYRTEQEVNNGLTPLWHGSSYARGYYFFRLRYTNVEGQEFEERGKVLVVR